MIDLVLESINEDLLKSIDETAHRSFLLIAILTEIPMEKKASSPLYHPFIWTLALLLVAWRGPTIHYPHSNPV